MTRVLDFSGPKSTVRFELCYIAILGAGDQKGLRDRATIRKEARLLDALDSISRELGTLSEIGSPRALSSFGGRIQIQEEDHALLVQYADKTPWTPKVSRQAVDVQDFLSSAEKVE